MGKLNDFAPEIISEILCRLPTETVLECKLVCKGWRNLVSHPSFSQKHLTHLTHAGKFTILIVTNQSKEENYQMIYNLEYDENHHETVPFHHRITRFGINLPFVNMSFRITGSCNGLICLDAGYDGSSFDWQPAFVWNPITKEHVFLPKLNRAENPKTRILKSGFGYLRETNEYKVVRITQQFESPNVDSFEVFTLGSGKGWRNIGEDGLSFSVALFNGLWGVFANEALYWITKDRKIMAFNLADEKFYELPTRPFLCENRDLRAEIEVLSGFLCCFMVEGSMTELGEDTRKSGILLLKKAGNQNMMELEEYMSWTWVGCNTVDPLALMKSSEVLCYRHPNFYSYDINSCCLKTLVNFPRACQQISHMSTLISLKALGEDTKTME